MLRFKPKVEERIDIIPFGQLEVAQSFVHDDTVYMKIESIATTVNGTNINANAVRISKNQGNRNDRFRFRVFGNNDSVSRPNQYALSHISRINRG